MRKIGVRVTIPWTKCLLVGALTLMSPAVTWPQGNPLGTEFQVVFGQRFGQIVPVELTQFEIE